MKPMYWILLLVLTLVTLGAQLWGPENPHAQAWDGIPLFYVAFGFVGCLSIIAVAKGLGKVLLQKREDYYDRED